MTEFGLRMPTWIPVTIAAAFFQVWRTALQARLRTALSATGAAYVRYLYALPLDTVLLLVAWAGVRAPFPALAPRVLGLCLIGGVGQIIGTILLIQAFGRRNFVVGTAYAKTEAAQLVLFSVVVLGVHLPALAIAGILTAVVGVLSLSFVGHDRVQGLLRASLQPAALLGLGAGTAFAITALALRRASLLMPAATPVLFKGLLLLLVTNTLQTLIQGAYMAVSQPATLRQCLSAWRRAAPVGVLSALGSWGWFTGFCLTHAALVRGLGQIEIVFTFLFGHHLLKERVRLGEVLSVVVVVLGVTLIAVSGHG